MPKAEGRRALPPTRLGYSTGTVNSDTVAFRIKIFLTLANPKFHVSAYNFLSMQPLQYLLYT